MTGKLVAAALGYLAGGPVGLLLGVILGHWFDTAMRGLRPEIGVQRRLIELCFGLMGRVCKVDGVVSQSEIDAAKQVMARLRIEGELREAAIRAFNSGKETDYDVDAAVAELRSLCQGRQLWLRLALEVLLAGAAADGRVDAAERELLLKIAAGLGFSPADLDRLLNLLGGHPDTTRDAGDRLTEAYRVLGVSADAPDAQVKTAYRRLMSQHHPDKLAARGLPDAMRHQAEEQTRKIRTAWEAVKSARGL